MSDPTMIPAGWLLPTGLGGMLVLKAFDWWKSRKSLSAAEGGATALLESMTARMQALDARVTVLDERLAQEIKARIEAQEAAAMLRVRIRVLEHVLRLHGITMPPELDEPTRELSAAAPIHMPAA